MLVCTLFLIIYGLFSLRELPVDVFPDLNKPTVNIITETPGMAPEEVEVVVTRQIETVLNGMPNVSRIYSSSATGISVVRVQFDWGTDLRFARLAVMERLPLAEGRIPPGITPFLSPTSSIMGEIMMIGLSSETGETTPGKLRSLTDWNVRLRLLAIPGVSQVNVIGGEELQYQVLANAEALTRKQIPLHEFMEKISELSAASGGGYISKDDREWLIRNYGRILNAEELPETGIGLHMGDPVLLKDVADVKLAPVPKRGDASINGQPGVVLMIQKQPEADTLAVTQKVEEVLTELKGSLPSDIRIHNNLFKQADFINAAIANVREALQDGTLMVAIVLVLFLVNLRTTVITLTAIPISLLITAIIFSWMGVGVNTMTLGGLAIAIGELVDDAIVDVENVFRRLKENKQHFNPKPALQVVFEASSEIRNSIVLATIIVVLVFIPLFALSGVEGRIFTPIGIAYVTSLVVSLFVSLTLTPVLCYYLLPNSKLIRKEEGWVIRSVKGVGRKILEATLNHTFKVMGGCLLMIAAAVAVLPYFGQDFLPPFNEGSAMAVVVVRSGLSLEASNEIALKIDQELMKIPEVTSVGRRTGRADEDSHAAGVNHSEFEIGLKESERSRKTIFADLRKAIKTHLPDQAYISVSQPVTHRLDHILSGVKSQVAIKLFGSDLRILRQTAAELRNSIREVPGIVDLQVEGQVLFPQYKIYMMREDLAKYGILPGHLVKDLEAMLQGVVTGRIIRKERFYDVYVRLDETSREDMNAISKLPVFIKPTGEPVILKEVTDIFETSGPNFVEREQLQRRIVVSFNVTGRDLETTVEEAKTYIEKNVELPEGYFVEFGGQYKSQKEASRMVLILGGISLIGIFLVLYANFRSSWLALQLMVNVPLALVGSVAAVWFTERTFSVATLIGFITLCGISSRNGILMISHYIHLMKEEGESFGREMIIRGTLERLIPVLMTATSAILALTPLVLAQDQPGKEILHPVAVVIVGGLLSSTLLDILVTPAIFYRFGRKPAERLVYQKEEQLLGV